VHPVLVSFHLGGAELSLGAYATFYLLAWLAALSLGAVVAARRGVRWWRALLWLLAAGVAGIVGARLLDIATNWGAYAADPGLAYGLHFAGFSLYGGLLLAAAAGALLARPLRVPLWRTADSAVPGLVAAVVLMRTGCFLHGCCFGTVTSLPWGVTFPNGSPAWAYQTATGAGGLLGLAGQVLPVQPTQIYEMLAALVCGAVAVWLMRGRRAQRGAAQGDGGAAVPGAGRAAPAAGVSFLVFVLGFTLFRVAELYLRPRPVGASGPVWLYPALYAVIIIGVTAALVWRRRTFAGGVAAPARAEAAIQPPAASR
jgi:phosphatidylglycerol---prolipoprotein diacylglyceryl transferase